MLRVQITALGEKKEKSKPSEWHILSKAGVYVTAWAQKQRWTTSKFWLVSANDIAEDINLACLSYPFLERTKPFSKWLRWLLSYFSKGGYRAAIIPATQEKWNHHNSLQHWWISTEQNLLLMLWFELLFEKYELHHSLFKAGYHSSVLETLT